MNEQQSLGYEATCRRKVQYDSQLDAEKAIARMKSFGRGDETLAAYTCPVCSNWHIGHTPVTALEKLPRLVGYEFVGVRRDGTLAHCTSFVNGNGLIVIYGQANRHDLKGWIEPKWFAPEDTESPVDSDDLYMGSDLLEIVKSCEAYGRTMYRCWFCKQRYIVERAPVGTEFLCKPCSLWFADADTSRWINAALVTAAWAKDLAFQTFNLLCEAKMQDSGWTKPKVRRVAYQWLSESIGQPDRQVRLGALDIEQSLRFVELVDAAICEPATDGDNSFYVKCMG